MRFSTLDQWLKWQETAHPVGIDLGLDRVGEVAERLGLVTVEFPRTVITVAGTNGKGSCICALDVLLRQSGATSGSFTSPHISSYCERIHLQGEPASEQDLMAAFEAIDSARGEISLTYFEFSALAAMWLLKQHRVQYWLLEVGLGGRLDATNIIDCDYAIVTSIDLDHTDWLGDTRELIGVEKAEICRPSKPLLCVDPNPPQSIAQVAQRKQARYFELSSVFDGVGGFNAVATARYPLLEKIKFDQLQLPEHSVAAALWCLLELGVLNDAPPGQLQQVLDNLHLTGRFQQISLSGRAVILDVAHNQASIKRCADLLQKKLGPLNEGIDVVLGMMQDKNIAASLPPLIGLAKNWYVCSIAGSSRAATAQGLAKIVTALQPGAEVVSNDSVTAGLAAALKNNTARPILVVGSFLTVAGALELIESNTPSAKQNQSS